MNINKWILLIASLLIIIINCHAQVDPDTLIGTYVGERWYKLGSDIDWTISIDTAYVLSVDTINCLIENLYPATLPSGTSEFETTYTYCNDSSSNWFSRFYSIDSLFIKYDDVSQPPPNFKLWSSRFYGKKISSAVPNAIRSTKIESQYICYPNPFQNEINISFNNNQNRRICLLSIKGKSVFYGEVATRNFIIPTMDLSSGLYLLQIVSNNSINNFKLIKQ